MEDKHKKILGNNMSYLCHNLDAKDVLPYLLCLSQPSKQVIECRYRMDGAFQGTMKLHEYIIRCPEGWNQLLAALRDPNLQLTHIADRLDPQPEKVKEDSNKTKKEPSEPHEPCEHREPRARLGSERTVDGDTPFNDLNAGVRDILKQLDHSPGPDKLAGEMGFSNKDYQDIKAHNTGDSDALAFIDRWNSREEVTLVKLMNVLKKTDRRDVLHDLVKYTGYKLPDDSDDEDEPDGDVPKASDTKDQQNANNESVISDGGQSSSPVITMPTRRSEDVPQVLVHSQFPGQVLSETDPTESVRHTDLVTVNEADSSQSDLTSQLIVTSNLIGSNQPNGLPAVVPRFNILLDRSISVDQGMQPLEPFNVSEPSQITIKERDDSTENALPGVQNNSLHQQCSAPVVRIQRYPSQANSSLVRVHLVQQESQNSGDYHPVQQESQNSSVYMPVGRIDKSPGGVNRPRLENAQQDRMRQQAGLEGFQQGQNNVPTFLGEPTSQQQAGLEAFQQGQNNVPTFLGEPTSPQQAGLEGLQQGQNNVPTFLGEPTSQQQAVLESLQQGQNNVPTFLGEPTSPQQAGLEGFQQGQNNVPTFLGEPTSPQQAGLEGFQQGQNNVPTFLGEPTSQQQAVLESLQQGQNNVPTFLGEPTSPQQAGLEGFQQGQNNLPIVLEGPASPHDVCMDADLYMPPGEIDYLENTIDSMNNNAESLPYPSASNCRSIVREGIMAETSMGGEMKDLRQLRKGLGGKYKPEEISGGMVPMDECLSSFDSTRSEASCSTQVSQVSVNSYDFEAGNNTNSEGELTGILRKGNKVFPEPRAETLNNDEELSDNWTSLDDTSIMDDELFGSPSTECPHVANSFSFQEVLNRGPADATVTPRTRTTEMTARNAVNTNDNEQSNVDARTVSEMYGSQSVDSARLPEVGQNSNTSQYHLQSQSSNFNLNTGFHEAGSVADIDGENDTMIDSHENHSSLFQSFLATAISESDSLPLKEFFSGVAGLTALYNTMKQKKKQ